jgi:hypothetical protein
LQNVLQEGSAWMKEAQLERKEPKLQVDRALPSVHVSLPLLEDFVKAQLIESSWLRYDSFVVTIRRTSQLTFTGYHYIN